MTRHELRKEVFKAVFQNEFHDADEMSDVLKNFMDGRENAEEDDLARFNMTEDEQKYISDKATKLIEKLPEYDELINATVDGWKTSRMAKVDLTLIRLALYEIKEEQLPVGVAIDEAVSLADEFGTDNSANFVNGCLSKLIKK